MLTEKLILVGAGLVLALAVRASEIALLLFSWGN
jgi:hypothetical protein